jgi:hypothetical protein
MVWQREPRDSWTDTDEFLPRGIIQPRHLTISQQLVGIVGKVWPYVKLSATNNQETVCAVCYTIEETDAFINARMNKTWRELWNRRPGKGSRHYRPDFGIGRRTHLEAWFNEAGQNPTRFAKLFDDAHSPVFIARRKEEPKSQKWMTKITWNTCLKDIEFYRIMDPYTCFQEIAMWWANQAVPQKPIPHVPDEVMVGAKGFDKFSFRKDPTRSKR